MSRQNWGQLVRNLVAGGVLRSPKVIRAMNEVDRADFLSEDLKVYCAVDSPFVIGYGQTISAPHD